MSWPAVPIDRQIRNMRHERKHVSFEDHLLAVLRSVPGAESLDDLVRVRGGSPPTCADFLLEGRKVVVELKSLDDSRAGIIRDSINEFRRSPLWVPLPRDMDWREVVRFQPHGQALQRTVTDRVTKHLERIVRKAQRQIRSTKQVFSIPEAHGVLVVLNDGAPVIDAKVMVGQFSSLTCRRAAGGHYRYPAIEATLLIPINDLIRRPDGSTDGALIFGTREMPTPPALLAAGTSIMNAWAAYWRREIRTETSITTDSDIAAIHFEPHKPPIEV
jgi:hypothetical protein